MTNYQFEYNLIPNQSLAKHEILNLSISIANAMIIDDLHLINKIDSRVTRRSVSHLLSRSEHDAAKEIVLVSCYLKVQQFRSIETASQTMNYDIIVKVNSVGFHI